MPFPTTSPYSVNYTVPNPDGQDGDRSAALTTVSVHPLMGGDLTPFIHAIICQTENFILFVPFGPVLTVHNLNYCFIIQSGQCTGKTLFEGGYTPGSSVFLDISNIDGFTAGANVTGKDPKKKKKKGPK